MTSRLLAVWLVFVLAAAVMPAAAVEIEIVNGDDPGEGLNDPTPRAPIGDNTGTTVGAQRRIALQYAAAILGSRLYSTVPIRIAVRFERFSCGVDNARLAAAGTRFLVSDFPGAPVPDTFYPIALANALSGQRLQSGTDISATFNAALDSQRPTDADCLGGADWYYGLDNNTPPGSLNFLSTAVHELTHGLGFASFVILNPNSPDGEIGQFSATADGRRLPDIYSAQIRDLSIVEQPLWTGLTAAQRAESATHGPAVVWSGNSTNSAAGTLRRGVNQGRVQLYAPDPILLGSSISHWGSALSPDQIMEPFTTPKINVVDGLGFTTCLLQDIGWRLINNTRCPDMRADAIAGPVGVASAANGSAPDDYHSDDGGSGGGGCTVSANADFDPVLPLLVLMALGVIGWRRRAPGMG